MDTFEKKYNEALEKARIYRDNAKAVEDYAAVARYENIFPELRESEDERIRKALILHLQAFYSNEVVAPGISKEMAIAYLEKQKVTPMPNSTELIEMWHKVKAILKEKDFRGDEWRLAQNAFMDGFARGTCVKFEKQKEQKPAEKQDYSGLNDLEQAIHRAFLCAGVENVPVTIIKETARECLALKPVEWLEEDEIYLQDALWCVEQATKVARDENDMGACWSAESWLKSLRPSWKPSEEQMKALEIAFRKDGDDKYRSTINSLYNDLKKL